jgi:hypothetical protein
MSQTVAAFQRCPRCGNENTADSYACNFCGFRLKIERIEKIRFFRRYEAEWMKPYRWYMKIFYLFVNAPKAFHDINHKRSKAPGWLILFFCSLLYGLMGLAIFSHVSFTGIPPYTFGHFLYGMVFLIFTDKLQRRFGGLKEEKEKYKETDISPFSIYKGGTMLQLEGAYKFRMMLCAFAPFLAINAIKILIVAVGFPTVNDFNIDQLFDAPTWAVLDVIDALTLATWVPILMTLAIRELSNSSTTRVLIPNIIIGVIVAIIFYFLRPTLFG